MDSVGVSSFIKNLDYKQYSNRALLAGPLVVFGLAVLVILGWVVATGAPVGLGVEFVGGTELRVSADAVSGDAEQKLQTIFPVSPDSVRSVPSENTYIVTFKKSSHSASALETAAENAGFTVRASSDVAPSFGAGAQSLALTGVAIAFAGMSVVVFLLFRSLVPSVAVVASALSDLVVPIAVMNIVGIDLTLGTVAALLMLIGYSVDSDVLLNDYVIRRGGSFYESVYAAMETGVTMTLTSLVAMSVTALGGLFLGVPLLRDIGFILTVGLVVDLMNTYMMNVSLLRWYKFTGVAN